MLTNKRLFNLNVVTSYVVVIFVNIYLLHISVRLTALLIPYFN